MEWRLKLVSSVIFLIQAVIFFSFWQFNLLEESYAQWVLAILIVFVGACGGYVEAKIRNSNRYLNSRSKEVIILAISGIFFTASAFILFAPFMYLLMHATVVAFLILTGILVPSLAKHV